MTSELHVNEGKRPVIKHDPPRLSLVDKQLKFEYIPSSSGIESNLLILLHGLGDTCKPFAQLGKSLNLPQTAVLSLQAPGRVPLLEEEAYCWWPSFTELGELIPNPNPTETITLLLRVLEYLTDPASSPHAPAWQPSQIHLFGFAQGGSCAGELALAWSRQHRLREISSTTTTSSDSNSGLNGHNEQEQEQDLGSIVAVSAPLLSHPTVSRKSHTKVLLTIRRGEERMVGASSWSKGFESVQTVNLGQGGQGMLRGQSEWIEVMRFWSTVLVQRSALELSAGVYEVRGGTNAARSAGAGP